VQQFQEWIPFGISQFLRHARQQEQRDRISHRPALSVRALRQGSVALGCRRGTLSQRLDRSLQAVGEVLVRASKVAKTALDDLFATDLRETAADVLHESFLGILCHDPVEVAAWT